MINIMFNIFEIRFVYKRRMNVSTIRMLSFRQEFNDTRIKFGVDESSTTVGNFLQVLTLWFPDRYN